MCVCVCAKGRWGVGSMHSAEVGVNDFVKHTSLFRDTITPY